MALADKVSVRHDDAITALGAMLRHKVRVEVFLTDGTALETTVEAPRGSEHNFASAADVIAKFKALALHALPATQVDALCEAMLHVDELDDAARIVRLMSQHE